jgi:hypothetical protein
MEEPFEYIVETIFDRKYQKKFLENSKDNWLERV